MASFSLFGFNLSFSVKKRKPIVKIWKNKFLKDIEQYFDSDNTDLRFFIYPKLDTLWELKDRPTSVNVIIRGYSEDYQNIKFKFMSVDGLSLGNTGDEYLMKLKMFLHLFKVKELK